MRAGCLGAPEHKVICRTGVYLVEEVLDLVARQLQGSFHLRNVILLEAQGAQDGCLQGRQGGRQMTQKVGLREGWEQVQDEMVVHKVVRVCLQPQTLVWK